MVDQEKIFLDGYSLIVVACIGFRCIPVIIQDNIFQAFETDEVLDYPSFSLRVNATDIPRLHLILQVGTAMKVPAGAVENRWMHRRFCEATSF